MIARICDNPKDSGQSIGRYTERRQQLEQTRVLAESKGRVRTFIAANIERHQQLQDARAELASLEARAEQRRQVEGAKGMQPGIPLIGMGVAGFSLLMSGVWAGFLVVAIGVGIYVGIQFSKRSQWSAAGAAYEQAQRDLQDIQSAEGRLRGKIGELTKVIALEQANSLGYTITINA